MPGVFDRGPAALGGFVAVRPVRRQVAVAARVDELEAAAAAVRPLAPAPAGAVGHLVHHDVDRVGDQLAELVGAIPRRPACRGGRVAAVGQLAAVIAKHRVAGLSAGMGERACWTRSLATTR